MDRRSSLVARGPLVVIVSRSMGPKSTIWVRPELFLENLIKFVEVFNKIAINSLLALAVILSIIIIQVKKSRYFDSLTKP